MLVFLRCYYTYQVPGFNLSLLIFTDTPNEITSQR